MGKRANAVSNKERNGAKKQRAAEKGQASSTQETQKNRIRNEESSLKNGLSQKDAHELKYKVDRILAGPRLKHFDTTMLHSRRNSKGQSPTEVLEEAILARGIHLKSYLSTEFFIGFNKDFNLNNLGFIGLPNLDPKKVVISPELCVALAELPDGKVAPFLRYLEQADNPLHDDFVGMLHASVESARLSRACSHVMQLGILGYIGRGRLHVEFRAIWEVVEDRLQLVLANEWTDKSTKQMTRAEFVRKHRHACSIFFDMEVCRRVEEALAKEEIPSHDDLRHLLVSHFGQVLFANEKQKVEFDTYLQNIKARIGDLHHHDFMESEVRNFQKLSEAEAKALVSVGFPAYKSRDAKFKFLTDEVEKPTKSIYDHPDWTLLSELETIAVSNNLVTRFPWEQAVYGDGKVPGYERDIIIPTTLLDDLLNDARTVRSMFCRTAELRGLTTFHEWKAEVNKNFKTYTDTDRTFGIKAEWLFKFAEPRCVSAVRELVEAALPDPRQNSFPQLKDSLAKMELVRLDKRTPACHPNLATEIKDVFTFLYGVKDEGPPSSSLLNSMCSWTKGVVARAEHFLTHVKHVPQKGKSPKIVLLSGREAMAAIWDIFQKSKDNNPDPNRIKEIKSYRWMLSAEQDENFNAWHKKFVKTQRADLVTKLSLKDDVQASPAEVSTSSASSSSKAKVAAVLVDSALLTLAKMPKGGPAKAKKNSGPNVEPDERLLSMLCGGGHAF